MTKLLVHLFHLKMVCINIKTDEVWISNMCISNSRTFWVTLIVTIPLRSWLGWSTVRYQQGFPRWICRLPLEARETLHRCIFSSMRGHLLERLVHVTFYSLDDLWHYSADPPQLPMASQPPMIHPMGECNWWIFQWESRSHFQLQGMHRHAFSAARLQGIKL
jgi:hypothetical protein